MEYTFPAGVALQIIYLSLSLLRGFTMSQTLCSAVNTVQWLSRNVPPLLHLGASAAQASNLADLLPNRSVSSVS